MLPLERPEEVSTALVSVVRRVNRDTRENSRPAGPEPGRLAA